MLKGNYSGTDDSGTAYPGEGYFGTSDSKGEDFEAGYSESDYSGTDYSRAEDYDIEDFGSDNPEADYLKNDYSSEGNYEAGYSEPDYQSPAYSRKKGASITKIMKNATVAILFLTAGLILIFFMYSHFFTAGERNFSGEWTANLDMTEQTAFTALDWLQDIEDIKVSLTDMEAYMHGLTVQVKLDMEQTGRYTGTFHCHIQPDSYEACNQAAYEAFAMGFRELLGERLRMAGYEGDTSQEAVEALVTETFGMSTVSYLMSCGPALLPSLEEMQAKYDGSGTYEVTEGVFIRQFDVGGENAPKEEYYLRKDDTLILTKEADSAASGSFFMQYPIIYTLNR